MLRLLTLLCIAALVTFAPAAPIPTHLFPKEPPLYFPTKVGTRWVYQDDIREDTEVVTKVENRDGTKLVFVALEVKGEVRPWAEVEVSPRGLYRVWYQGRRDDPPVPWLRLPLERGKVWECDRLPAPNDAFQFRMAAFDAEDVEVPAGKYRAIRVEVSYRAFPGPGDEALAMRFTTTNWYAPGVGLVKSAGGSWEQVLKSFTPGKD